MALFMANTHKSVNEISAHYLQNERRYNYTTPKSFLEQIALYQNLLGKQHQDLQAKMMRLENGLEKLKSTASQVDDLKAKLAAQEVELAIKNEEANKLIQVNLYARESVLKDHINPGSYGVGNLKTLLLLQFSSDLMHPLLLIKKMLTITENRLLLYLAISQILNFVAA